MSEDKLAEIEARRAARKVALDAQYREQRVKDLEALEQLECTHGEGNVAYVDLNSWSPGLPTLVAARASKPIEIKRYRARIKIKDGQIEGSAEAAEELAAICRTYPIEKDDYAAVLEARPGIGAALGGELVRRATAQANEAGKG